MTIPKLSDKLEVTLGSLKHLIYYITHVLGIVGPSSSGIVGNKLYFTILCPGIQEFII